MALDIRTAQTEIENAIHDAILYALGWRLPAVATIAELRDVTTAGASGATQRNDDDLINIVVGGLVTAAYRWSTSTTTDDNGSTVIRPTDVNASSPGRWLLWTSDMRFEQTVGGVSYPLNELLTGPLKRVAIVDQAMAPDEFEKIIKGRTPSVLITADDDEPERLTLSGGRYVTLYRFTITVVAQNLRSRRQHVQGSTVDDEDGAYYVDGQIRALLRGIRLRAFLGDSLIVADFGRGENWTSRHLQRRVFRQRTWTVRVYEAHTPASNNTGELELLNAQGDLADLGEASEFDEDNYVSSGITVPVGVGLTKPIAAGTATIDGDTVTYAGELKTFTASKDTYRDLLPDGTLEFVEVDIDSEEPAVTATAMRIGVTRTDADSVIADTMIAITAVDYGSAYQVIPSS